jgi:hypothetical protein
VALVAPPGSTAIDEDDGPIDVEEIHEPIVLSGVEFARGELETRLREVATAFYPDNSHTLGMTYWMNHCQRCGAKIGDHYLHHEPDGPFFSGPGGNRDGRLISLSGGEIVCAMPYLAPSPSPARTRNTRKHR